MANRQVGVFVGSLRKEAHSLKITKNIINLPHEGYDFTMIPIAHLPFYNQDFDDFGPLPESFADFRKTVKALDALLFVTPEYNRSVPAVLKNALDVGSRPSGKSVWNGKPAGIITSSIGIVGGFGANHHLRQILSFLNVFPMQQPEAYLTKLSAASFDENNRFTETRSQDFIERFLKAYLNWIGIFLK